MEHLAKFALAIALTGCAVETGEISQSVDCALTGYIPFTNESQVGTASELPWDDEHFDYAPLPATVECSSNKAQRSHLDVTSGCLTAINTGGTRYTRGQIKLSPSGGFRAVALGSKWTDGGASYRFYYTGPGDLAGVDPGFKAFVRYQSEDNLYVASWRLSGLALIQKKVCGVYTSLDRVSVPPPATGVWHSLRFFADGDLLTLYLNGSPIATAADSDLEWGAIGIRTDSSDGALIDDWRLMEI